MIELPTASTPHLVIHGDCIDVLRELPAESIHVAIEDPPAGIGFMGKIWDSFAGYQPRTVAGRNALRMLTSLSSSDVTIKALAAAVKQAKLDAKAANDKRMASAVVKALSNVLARAREALRGEAGDLIDFAGLEPWAAGFVAFLVDAHVETYRVLKPGAWLCSWALPKTADLAALALRLAGFELHDNIVHLFGEGMPHGLDISKALDKAAGAERAVIGEYLMPMDSTAPGLRPTQGMGYGSTSEATLGRPITAPATSFARAWSDWNTQLAPGHEQWLLARKPSPLTFAANVVEHGTGAMHIGACRVERGAADRERATASATQGAGPFASSHTFGDAPRIAYAMPEFGGYPSNVVLSHSADCLEGRCVDGCPALALDQQSGVQRDGVAVKRNLPPEGAQQFIDIKARTQRGEDVTFAGTGGSSRFFTNIRYQAKASRRDIPGRADITIDHPTHKSLGLMRWLVRLLAAKTEQVEGGAIILDKFAGSGTTGAAAAAEGLRFIGVEQNAASVEQARARIAAITGDVDAAREAIAKAPAGSQLALL
jgi:DNA modification methylase